MAQKRSSLFKGCLLANSRASNEDHGLLSPCTAQRKAVSELSITAPPRSISVVSPLLFTVQSCVETASAAGPSGVLLSAGGIAQSSVHSLLRGITDC
jgi:hypothetical protein